MRNYNMYTYKSDLNSNNKRIHFKNLDNKDSIKKTLKKELKIFIKEMNIKKGNHIFIVGLGNDNYTADSIGPNTLKYIKVNAFLENIGIKINNLKISALEPGVLGETGIETEKIISSVANEIRPDLIVLIDSFVSDDIDDLNKTIEINNIGLTPGSGIKGINTTIDKNTLGIPILVIGVVTSILVKFTKDSDTNFIPYLLSTKDIDDYIKNISKIIGESLNEVINDL